MTYRRFVVPALAAALLLAGSARAADSALDSLKQESPELKSAGPIAMGPEGILFVGDPQAAAILAIDTGDRAAAASTDRPKVEGIDEKIASLLGIEAKQLLIKALAVNPISGNTYLSVARGKGPDAKAVLLRVARDGKLSEVNLKGAKYAAAKLPNPAAGRQRQEAITCLAYLKGRVFVSGLSNEDFSSNLRAIPFPFTEANGGAGIEIFHGAHGRFETKSPVRTFTPYDINGEAHLLAAYQCTPLVKIPVAQLKPGEKVKGTTVAELGNRNRPLDMIVYQKDGKDYILMANSSRGVMKIPTEGIDKVEAVTKPVRDKAGLKYETIASLKGVEHLDRFGRDHALLLVKTGGGAYNLDTIELP
ncbi:MAG TPA: hypothetical protein VFE78_12280 [Gemmataceae bacterium]|jgi:hypothetical protein|nr:hypothetical protein [Gemmataceae bacterium]